MEVKYDQLHFSDKEKGTKGDCMAACIKTILQDPLENFPHPIKGDHWNYEFWEMLEEKHSKYIMIKSYIEGEDYSDLPDIIIASGPTIRTERTGATHAVVWDRVNHTLIHDPNPSRAGLINIDNFWWLKEVNDELV